MEHNNYTGFEVQPSIRMSWTPTDRSTVWTSVSRAVRTPSRFEHDATVNWTGYVGHPDLPLPPGVPQPAWILRLYPNKNFESEDLIAYELGYRVEPNSRVSFDLAAFYNTYNHYRTFEVIGNPFMEMAPIERMVVPLQSDNKGKAQTTGVEAAWNWRATDRWQLSGNYTYLKVDTETLPSSNDFILVRFRNNYPNTQFSIRSYLDLSHGLELDAIYYGSSSVHNQWSPLAAMNRLDVRLGWRMKRNITLSVGGQNVLGKSRKEAFTTFLDCPADITRCYYGQLTCEF